MPKISRALKLGNVTGNQSISIWKWIIKYCSELTRYPCTFCWPFLSSVLIEVDWKMPLILDWEVDSTQWEIDFCSKQSCARKIFGEQFHHVQHSNLVKAKITLYCYSACPDCNNWATWVTGEKPVPLFENNALWHVQLQLKVNWHKWVKESNLKDNTFGKNDYAIQAFCLTCQRDKLISLKLFNHSSRLNWAW